MKSKFCALFELYVYNSDHPKSCLYLRVEGPPLHLFLSDQELANDLDRTFSFLEFCSLNSKFRNLEIGRNKTRPPDADYWSNCNKSAPTNEI